MFTHRKPSSADEPASLKRWKLKHPNGKYCNFHSSKAKKEMKAFLIRNQKFLCCYCETRVFADTSHIEHIEPQLGGQAQHSMDIANLTISCIKDPHKVAGNADKALKDSYLHCGHARGISVVASPYDFICQKLFTYSFSGEVLVNESLEDNEDIILAQESIQNLRLNVPTLVNLRKQVMYDTIMFLEGGVDSDSIIREINGKYPPFVSCAKTAIRAWSVANSNSYDKR